MIDLTKTEFMTKEQMREAAPAVFTHDSHQMRFLSITPTFQPQR